MYTLTLVVIKAVLKFVKDKDDVVHEKQHYRESYVTIWLNRMI